MSANPIWVHADSTVTSDDSETKALLKSVTKSAIQSTVTEQILKSLPRATFSTKFSDKPKAISTTNNALKITGTLKLQATANGSNMTVKGELKAVFEAIRAHESRTGNLLASGSKGATVERRASGEQGLVALAKEVLDNIVQPLVSQIVCNPQFSKYVGMVTNMELECEKDGHK